MPGVYLNKLFLFGGFSLIAGGSGTRPRDGGGTTLLAFGISTFKLKYFFI